MTSNFTSKSLKKLNPKPFKSKTLYVSSATLMTLTLPGRPWLQSISLTTDPAPDPYLEVPG